MSIFRVALLAVLLLCASCADGVRPGAHLLRVDQTNHGRTETWRMANGGLGRLWIPDPPERPRWLMPWEQTPR